MQLAKGPIRIVSVKILTGATPAKVLGISVRKLDANRIPYNEADGYPPTDPESWAGSESAEGANLAGPAKGDVTPSAYELMIGYRLPSAGKYQRTGIKLTFTYDGQTYTATLPSKVDLCVPRTVDCEHIGN